jgi:polyisoprenoid-binding protein YceI
VYRPITALVLALAVAGCGAPNPRPPAPAASPAANAPRNAAPNAAYRIDPAQSELRVLVYRAGVLASLGHNHVIVNRDIEGSVSFAGDPAAASFTLSIPANGFMVDDPTTRREEGADFGEETPDDAKEGTRHNMLGAGVLDAAEHPSIDVRSVSIRPAAAGFVATVGVSIAGHDATLVVPFTLELSGGRIVASGATSLKQSSLGLTPFSVMLGALRVQDELTLKFRLVATAVREPV